MPETAKFDENMGVKSGIIIRKDLESQKASYTTDQSEPDTMFIDNEDFIQLCPASDSPMGPYVI